MSLRASTKTLCLAGHTRRDAFAALPTVSVSVLRLTFLPFSVMVRIVFSLLPLALCRALIPSPLSFSDSTTLLLAASETVLEATIGCFVSLPRSTLMVSVSLTVHLACSQAIRTLVMPSLSVGFVTLICGLTPKPLLGTGTEPLPVLEPEPPTEVEPEPEPLPELEFDRDAGRPLGTREWYDDRAACALSVHLVDADNQHPSRLCDLAADDRIKRAPPDFPLLRRCYRDVEKSSPGSRPSMSVPSNSADSSMIVGSFRESTIRARSSSSSRRRRLVEPVSSALADTSGERKRDWDASR